jgi:hypothetical protein
VADPAQLAFSHSGSASRLKWREPKIHTLDRGYGFPGSLRLASRPGMAVKYKTNNLKDTSDGV